MNTFRRRTFLKAATTTAAGMAALNATAPLVRGASANSMINHAGIGVGGMGWVDLSNFGQHDKVRIAAVCDVDQQRLDHAGNEFPDANKYVDWRELLEAEGDRIDSAHVTVPDHMHFPIGMALLRRGKHIYMQKPMCHDVAEVRAMTLEAKNQGVKTQLGAQAASTTGSRLAEEYARRGVIGDITRIVMCSNRPGAIEQYRLKGPRPAEGDPVPDHMNWDLWLGNAPERHFNEGIYHPMLWRAWQDFGTGWSGDIGCHVLHAPWVSVGLTAPTKVRAEVQESWKYDAKRRRDTWPQSVHIVWTFPGTEATGGKEIEVDWYDGEWYPPQEYRRMHPTGNYPEESGLWVGEEGLMVMPNPGSPLLMPRQKFDPPRIELEPGHHYHDFVDAIIEDKDTRTDFQISGPMTEAVLLGTIAVRMPGVELTWDSEQMHFPHNPAADRLLYRDYRDGWGVEDFCGKSMTCPLT